MYDEVERRGNCVKRAHKIECLSFCLVIISLVEWVKRHLFGLIKHTFVFQKRLIDFLCQAREFSSNQERLICEDDALKSFKARQL